MPDSHVGLGREARKMAPYTLGGLHVPTATPHHVHLTQPNPKCIEWQQYLNFIGQGTGSKMPSRESGLRV